MSSPTPSDREELAQEQRRISDFSKAMASGSRLNTICVGCRGATAVLLHG